MRSVRPAESAADARAGAVAIEFDADGMLNDFVLG